MVNQDFHRRIMHPIPTLDDASLGTQVLTGADDP